MTSTNFTHNFIGCIHKSSRTTKSRHSEFLIVGEGSELDFSAFRYFRARVWFGLRVFRFREATRSSSSGRHHARSLARPPRPSAPPMASPAKPSWKRRWAAEAHLRGHRAEVTALCHHAASDLLLSGCAPRPPLASLSPHSTPPSHPAPPRPTCPLAIALPPSLYFSLPIPPHYPAHHTLHSPHHSPPLPFHPPCAVQRAGGVAATWRASAAAACEPSAAGGGGAQQGLESGSGERGRRGRVRTGLLSAALGAVGGEPDWEEGVALEEGGRREGGRGGEEVGTAASCAQVPPVLATPCDDKCTVALWDLRHPSTRSLSIGSPQGFPHAAPHPHCAASAGLPMALHLILSPSVSPALFLLAGYEDGRMALWDVRSPARPLTAARLHSQPVQSVAVWGSAEHGVSGGADTDTVFFRLFLSQGSMEAVKRVRSQQPGTAAIALHPAGGVAATGGWDGSVRIYDCADRDRPRPATQLTHHSAAVTAVVFTPDGQLCSASRDATIALCRSR
ncbi:unnamed protein product [Closterium sp. Yama58-4]|nr:unnamed protein product [Closterium sp. Yama58-4]